MDNVQNINNCINISSSRTFRSQAKKQKTETWWRSEMHTTLVETSRKEAVWKTKA
jgi:hypothetical protein